MFENQEGHQDKMDTSCIQICKQMEKIHCGYPNTGNKSQPI